jgi:TRAP-type C4-dicarboxylate transport system permease small subunit
MRALVDHVDRFVGQFCRWGVILCLFGLFILLGTAVIVRTVPFVSISGYDEIVEFLFAWLTFLGALALWRENGLYRVMLVEAAASAPLRWLFRVMTQALMLIFALTLAVKGHEFLQYAGERTPFLGADKTWWYLSVPASGAIMSIYSAIGLVRAVLGRSPETSATPGLD